jgi:flagellar hook-associated protein 3 FlgL
MRVATKTMYDSLKYNLGAITEALSKANEVVSSGKRITNLSDDPIGLAQALDIKSTLSTLQQVERNIDMGKSWLNSAESALTSVQALVSDARALCVQMSTATTGEAERVSAAATIQNTLDEIVSLANTEVNGRYIFAGSDTDSVPFNEDGSYNGDDRPFTVSIGKGLSIAVGNNGEAVFEDIFQTLSDLKDALEGNDVEGIQGAIDGLDEYFDHVATTISDIGSKLNRLEIKKTILSDLNLSNTDRLSKIKDADIAEAIIELSSKKLAYQAVLSSSAKVMELSLVDYLS